MSRGSFFDKIIPFAAVAAFILIAIVFFAQIKSFRAAVELWAKRDLNARVILASSTLGEMLKKGNYRQLTDFGSKCHSDGFHLRILTADGGVFYDSGLVENDNSKGEYFETVTRYGYEIQLGICVERVFEPFERAKKVFLVSVLLGSIAVVAVFSTFYRQRRRIVELNRLEEFQRRFIADVSHELKTPLTGIMGVADLLSSDLCNRPEVRNKFSKMILDSSRRLNDLIQSIISLSRLDSKACRLDKSMIDVHAFLAQECEKLAFAASSKGVNLTYHSGQDLHLFADSNLLSQAISNLIMNAITHSGSDKVDVSCRKIKKHVVFIVEDYGVGIPQNEKNHIFERFYRIDKARQTGNSNSGLGLAIVKNIASLHGGNVRVEDVSPHGCRFILSIPSSTPRFLFWRGG